MLEVRIGKLKIAAHPLLMEWGPPQSQGWAAAARLRRRRVAATRLYAQAGFDPAKHCRIACCLCTACSS